MDCWIPEEEFRDCSESWSDYDKRLYAIFRADFVESRPIFNGFPVKPRTNPYYDEREESFWHLTCRDYGHTNGGSKSRDPDLERCRRIRWPRAFIDNYLLCAKHDIQSSKCRGVLIWESTHKTNNGRSTDRVKLFLDEERYLLVLEKRQHYYLLITAYYVDEEYSYKGLKREAARKNAKYAGSAC